MATYRDFLVRASGRRPLDVLIDRRLVEREAARLKLSVTEAAIAEAVGRVWDSYLERLNGDEGRFVAELKIGGFEREEFRSNLRDQARQELLAQAVCRATRVITEELLRARFQSDFGESGDQVEVRHIFLSASRLRADLISEGTPAEELGPARLESLCRERLEEVLERLESGEPFDVLAGKYSHDFAAQATGGQLANYNYRAYGADFATAVRGAEVGIPIGPVQTESGFHVIEVTSRVHTEFAEIRETLRQRMQAEAATPTEIQTLIDQLRAKVKIETY